MSAHGHEEAVHVGGTTKLFCIVWIGLLALTAIEVFLAYIQTPLTLMLTILMGLSLIKAAMIIAYFMHLKFEKFSLFLILFPLLIFCIMGLFIFMPDAVRSLSMRAV